MQYAQDAYEAEHERFTSCELKVGRYLTALTVLLGLGAAGATTLKAKLAHIQTCTEGLFVFLFITAAVAGLVALGFILWVQAVHDFPGLPLDDNMVAFFSEADEKSGTPALALKYLEATRFIRGTNAVRYGRVTSAHRSLVVCFILAALAVAMFVVMPVSSNNPTPPPLPAKPPAPSAGGGSGSPRPSNIVIVQESRK